jgi:hypothetical protein
VIGYFISFVVIGILYMLPRAGAHAAAGRVSR